MGEWFRQYRSARFGIGVFVLFLVACVQSCSELKHSLWGIRTNARIVRAESSSYKITDEFLTLNFDDNDGKNHIIKRTVASKLGPFAVGQEVDVIYIAGAPDRARLVSERSIIWPAVLLAMSVAGTMWLFVALREVKAGRGI